MVIHCKFNAVRSRKSMVQSCEYYTVQFREKYGHSNITVNRNYYGQRLASKLSVFDRKSYMFIFKSDIYSRLICYYFYVADVIKLLNSTKNSIVNFRT